jgi:hypothetical protein
VPAPALPSVLTYALQFGRLAHRLTEFPKYEACPSSHASRASSAQSDSACAPPGFSLAEIIENDPVADLVEDDRVVVSP